MAKGNGKAGADSLGVSEIKKDILQKISECADGTEMERMAKAYKTLAEAEFTELRNFEEMLNIENRRKNPTSPYTMTANGYYYGTGTIAKNPI